MQPLTRPWLPITRALMCALVLSVSAAGRASATPYTWNLPRGFPTPNVPPGNPMTVEKVELGRFLFYDTRLSGNQTQACASCHQQALAFTDGLPRGIGSTGQMHPRGPMSLTNVAYNASFAWANPLLLTVEKQVLLPMFGETPVELGLTGKEDELPDRFQSDTRYRRLFAEAYPDDDTPFTQDVIVGHIVQGLTSFVRTLISGNAPYDRYVNGLDDNALSASALHGQRLFTSETLECFHCHGGFNFSDSVTFQGKGFDEINFHNNALYNIDGMGGYPPDNTGIFAFTQIPEDMGSFKAPTLRNIELTAPYMHDGTIATLDGVMAHYAAGGRSITDGPYAGDGSKNPFKSGFIRGFQISDSDTQDVLNFLKSLTDEEFIHNPRLSDPFNADAYAGDCDLDGTVTTQDLLTSVQLALDQTTLATCVVGDSDGDGAVRVDELVKAVNRAASTPTP